MMDRLPLPYLSIQSDWEEALCENEGQAWITCKLTGQPGTHGELQTVGLSGNGVPYVTASEGFRVLNITKNKINVTHEDPNCRCTFFPPKNNFKNIHTTSVVSMDVAAGGLGVSACVANQLAVWDTEKGIVRRQLTGHVGDVYSCRFFPSGVVVLSAGADMQVKIWSAETGQCPVTLCGHSGAILDTAIVERGRNVISVSRDGTAKLWDCGQAKCLATVAEVGDVINSCAVCVASNEISQEVQSATQNEREVGTTDKLLLLACEDGKFRGVAVGSRKQVFACPCPSAVNACSYVNNVQVVCGCQDGQIFLMDLRNMSSAVSSWLHSAAAVCSLLPYKGGFFCSKRDGTCSYYSNHSEESLQLSGSDCDPVYRIASDGTHLYTCCRDGVIRKYEVSL